MGPGDQRHSLSEAEDRESVAHMGEDAQEAAGKGLLSMGGDKRDRVLGTVAPLTSNQVQFIGYMQQFIDEATTLTKKCIYKLVSHFAMSVLTYTFYILCTKNEIFGASSLPAEPL
jgi:hypothetical protein